MVRHQNLYQLKPLVYRGGKDFPKARSKTIWPILNQDESFVMRRPYSYLSLHIFNSLDSLSNIFRHLYTWYKRGRDIEGG